MTLFQSLYAMMLAVILGGMLTFQLLFAPLLFSKLELPTARAFIRAFFPWYYLYFAALTAVALLLRYSAQFYGDAWVLLGCLLGFLLSGAILMPAANAASDAGDRRRFSWVHRLSVAINTVQLGAFVLLGFWFIH
ncbi:DUF4149 domain-containing protein [Ferrimonas marina]|uniref:TMEM205-like domain-containing protein n=1 Tax=Ferrimonas marina TaxID=299255 RepID=A0A1M5Z961_9GAMM|nr:DUF4149 domain-containing protein [Ferrimonas marina]SHI20765.1 protein of unknown function [Ferrimonas marina]